MLRYTVELAFFVSILMKRQARLTLDAPPFPRMKEVRRWRGAWDDYEQLIPECPHCGLAP